jgi:hypothetical protein
MCAYGINTVSQCMELISCQMFVAYPVLKVSSGAVRSDDLDGHRISVKFSMIILLKV